MQGGVASPSTMKEMITWVFSGAGTGWVFGVAVSLLTLIITRRRVKDQGLSPDPGSR
jgi:hypothetical protein